LPHLDHPTAALSSKAKSSGWSGQVVANIGRTLAQCIQNQTAVFMEVPGEGFRKEQVHIDGAEMVFVGENRSPQGTHAGRQSMGI
jgi:hypothetical protein